MRFIMLLVVALAAGGVIFYVYTEQQKGLQENVLEQQNAAQDAADAYRENQEEMMRQMGQ